jgi:D-amino peptidase
MKLLIAADMEGITGVTTWEQVDPSTSEYQRFRKLMTADVNAAIRGAFEAGANEIVVSDGHWNGSNILIEEIDPRARLNSGLTTAPLSMMQGIDESFEAVLFIGYHGRAGSQNAVLDHTWSTKLSGVWLNDTLVGEYGLNAALAGHFGVPVIMISGDQTACAQAQELLGALEIAVVKQATGRYSAECLPLALTQELIRNAARQAVQRLKKGNAPDLFVMDTPILVTVDFLASEMADRAMRIPGAERDGNRVQVSAPDMPSAYVTFRAVAGLGGG